MTKKQMVASVAVSIFFWAIGVTIALALFGCHYTHTKARPVVYHYTTPTVVNGITVGTTYGNSVQYITTGTQYGKPVLSITTATVIGNSVMVITTGDVK